MNGGTLRTKTMCIFINTRTHTQVLWAMGYGPRISMAKILYAPKQTCHVHPATVTKLNLQHFVMRLISFTFVLVLFNS